MKHQVCIKSDFPDVIEKKLIRLICRHEKVDKKSVFLSTFKRFGHSGAQIILLYFSSKPIGLPYIVKKALKKDIDVEFEAINSQLNIRDARLYIRDKFVVKDKDNEQWGALVYDFHGSDNTAKSLTLREIVYDFENYYNDDLMFDIFDCVLKKLSSAHLTSKWSTVSFDAYYKDYLRENLLYSDIRIKSILGSNSREKEFNFLFGEIYNPLFFLQELVSKDEIEVVVGPVHGDLHLDNVVINIDTNIPIPHLIDFAWAKVESDILVDYVLLENSLRFMNFPRKENIEEQLEVEKCYIDNKIELIFDIEFTTPEKKRLYTRQAILVSHIREKAINASQADISFERYLLTQFILLYGLMRYEDTYRSYIPLRTLGLIAKKLKEIES